MGGKRTLLLFSAVVASLLAAIAISCAIGIQTERALYRGYPMADPVEQEARMRDVKAEEIGKAEKRLVILVLLAIPVGIFLVRRKSRDLAAK